MCHDVDARLQSSWSKGRPHPCHRSRHADRLALSFAAAGLRVSGDDSNGCLLRHTAALPWPSATPAHGARQEVSESLAKAHQTARQLSPAAAPRRASLLRRSYLCRRHRGFLHRSAPFGACAHAESVGAPVALACLFRRQSSDGSEVATGAPSASARVPADLRPQHDVSEPRHRPPRWDARRGAASTLTVRSLLRGAMTATTTPETPGDALATADMARSSCWVATQLAHSLALCRLPSLSLPRPS